MAQEKIRGCGFRTVGSSYICGTGLSYPCDNLPLPLKPCSCCGYQIPFTRSWVWVHKQFLKPHGKYSGDETIQEGCSCLPTCPICRPWENIDYKFIVMWASTQFYTPNSFIKESQEMGVSLKIGFVPKDLKFNETWVLLAYKKYPFQRDIPNSNLKSEPILKPAIFYAFRPQRVEKLIWASEATPEKIREMEEQGFTPIIIKDGDKDHMPKR